MPTKLPKGVKRKDELQIPLPYLQLVTQKQQTLFDDRTTDAIDAGLLASIKEIGQQQPILVRKAPDFTIAKPKYDVVFGQNRVKCLRKLKFETARCSITIADDKQCLLFKVSENNNRRSYSPKQMMLVIEKMREVECSDKEMASALGLGKAQCKKYLDISDAEDLREAYLSGDISIDTAVLIKDLPEDKQLKIIDDKSSTDRAKAEVKSDPDKLLGCCDLIAKSMDRALKVVEGDIEKYALKTGDGYNTQIGNAFKEAKEKLEQGRMAMKSLSDLVHNVNGGGLV